MTDLRTLGPSDPRTFPRLIDDVAREMTAGDPTPGFRARVIERATAKAAEPRAWWRAPVSLAIAASAVVVLVAGLLVFQGQRATQPPAAVADAGATIDAVAAGREPDDPARVVEAGGQSVMRAAPRVVAAPLPASVLEWRARVIPELTAVAPLGFDEIQPKWLSIAQLDVTPLGIRPITFAPIGSEGGGRW